MFNRKQIKSWAGNGAFQRGEDYFRRGLVEAPTFSASTAEATVMGNYPYQVLLRWRGDFLHSECDCPMGEQGDFCKHCVAVALAWLEHGGASGTNRSADAQPLHDWLESHSHDELVEQILAMAEKHEDLYRELMLKASAGSLDLKQMKQSVRKAIGNRFVDYHGMPAYVRQLLEVTTMLEQLLDAGHAAQARELSAYAIERLGKALLKLDDSGGSAGDELQYWLQLHLRACTMQPPGDDKARRQLARDLFSRWLAAEWDEFANAPVRYAEVLGTAGLAEFRSLVQREWEKLPRLEPGDERWSFEAGRYKITAMRESVARASGDVDEMIRIKAHDLSSPFHFLELAEICRETGRHDEALTWAEQGAAAFPESLDTRLDEWLIDEYRRRGRHDKALARAWIIFERQPSLSAWQCLKKQASHAGEWHEWRPWALDFLRDRIASLKHEPAPFYGRKPDASLLVEILLHENEPEQALREAERHGCRNAQREALAMALGEHNPTRAVACLKPLVEPMIRLTDNSAYDQAVAWIEHIDVWMQKAGEPHVFEAWVADLARRYKAKRNFIKLLRRRGIIE